ncbi:hypothetical protein H0H81_007015 [Sphagnurus paluster]|uniref:Uncharacterized protein n=1 Tax=Sphagnurus paluster TaxID=117069 RepID=A0A9P7K5I6_9AGAR|nr:hypothetical protein H0H81_007015 [Sphagnurus paluster]
MSAYPAYVIGGLCIVGGVAGFARRRSIPSLAGGVTYVSECFPVLWPSEELGRVLSVGLLYLYAADAIRKGAPNGLEVACG